MGGRAVPVFRAGWFGMNPEGVMIYLADQVDPAREAMLPTAPG
jgi:hypothetical protein